MARLILPRIDKPYRHCIIGFIEKQSGFCQKLSNTDDCSGLNFTDDQTMNLDLKTGNGQLSGEISDVHMFHFWNNGI